MNMLTAAGIASLLALAISASAYPADAGSPAQSVQDDVQHAPPEPVTVTQPVEPRADSTAKAAASAGNSPESAKGDASFQARLKRCESLGSPNGRKECIEMANKERGQL